MRWSDGRLARLPPTYAASWPGGDARLSTRGATYNPLIPSMERVRSDEAEIFYEIRGNGRQSFFSILFLVITNSGIRWLRRSIRATG
jgi:hypothetical protein